MRFRSGRRRFLRQVLPAPLALVGWGSGCGEEDGPAAATVGAKDYPEQLMLGEIQALLLERQGLSVSQRIPDAAAEPGGARAPDRRSHSVSRHSMLGTFDLHREINAGEVDCFVEYTGTAYSAVLEETFRPEQTPDEIYAVTARLLEERQGLRLGPRLGFANDYAIALPAARAGALGLWRLSDLAGRPGLVLATGEEFLERADGLPGLFAHYGIEDPPEALTVDLNLVWEAVAAGDADLLVGNSTDGRIPARGMVVLEDDRNYFPPYEAAVLYRPDAPPEVARMAEVLGGAMDDRRVRDLNRRMEVDGQPPAEVAAAFLDETGLSL